ncbi:MAG: hypothetical protein AAB309_07660 [Deltaproteobacteria bacterium]
MKQTLKKVTLQLPRNLIQEAQKATGDNLTATVRKGLRIVAASRAYEELLKLKGKVRLQINLEDLRKDGGE